METQGKTDTNTGPNAETDTCSYSGSYAKTDPGSYAKANTCSYSCSYAKADTCSYTGSYAKTYTRSDTDSGPCQDLCSVQLVLRRMPRIVEADCISIFHPVRHQ